MEDKDKSKKQLLAELSEMRHRIVELERLEAEHKLAEKDLRESYEYAKGLFTASHIPLIVMDAETGIYVDCNEAAAQIYGYSNREDVLGKTPLDVSTPIQRDGSDSATEAKKHIQAGCENGSHVFEWRHQRPNGQIWDADVHLMFLQHQGKPLIQFQLQDITERKRAEAAIKKYSDDLKERNKELNCLYSISEIVRRNDISRESILQECASTLSQAYQFPEITVCQITWGDHEYSTENFRKTAWSQNRAIMVYGEQIGTIEVCYLEERQKEHEEPFLAEEHKLLNTVADLLGRSTERKQAEEEREKLIIELQEALAKVKTLSGFLPICASCKKIRNDEGYWEQMEMYIRNHSEAEFSHGICPECAEKLYSELYEKK